MTLTINKEFLKRHLFAVIVFAGMGVWFGYDGFVRYPDTSAAALYASIESVEPPPGMAEEKLQSFKADKIGRQREFCAILMLAALLVGIHAFVISRLKFSFDDDGFSWNGKRYSFGDVKSVDRSKWAKKGILKLALPDGNVTLDAWHHTGVAEFEKRLAR